MEKKARLIRLGIFLLAAVSVIAMDAKQIRYINSKGMELYCAQTGNSSFQELQNGGLESEFRAVSRHIASLRVWCEMAEGISGSISYRISDSQGSPFLFENKAEISQIINQDHDLQLEVTDVEFDPGERYYLSLEFDLDAPIRIQTDMDGAMLGQYYPVEYQAVLYVGLASINLLIVVFFMAIWKWGLNDKIFLALSIVVGVLAVLTTPPFSRDDEFRHFVRAYDWSYGGNKWYYDVPKENTIGNVFTNEEGKAQLIELPKEISELRLVGYDGNYTLISYHAEMNNSLCVPKLNSIFCQEEEGGVAEVAETATAWKGLESYWPQTIMILLGRFLNIRSGLWYYLAGIGQVLTTSVMLWFALRLTGKHKNLVWVFSFIPVITLLRGSCNPDGLMIAEVFLCLAIILRLREYSVNLLGKKGLILLAVYLTFTYQIYKMKLPYALLCIGYLLLLQKENFIFINWVWIKKHRLSLICGAGILCAFGAIYFIGIRKGDTFLRIVYKFLPREHYEYILSHFGEFLAMYLRKGGGLLKQTFESLRGDYYISYGVFSGIVLLLSKKAFSVVQKGYQVFLYLCVLGMIVLVGYTLTPPDYGQIWGITYRYMLPALPVLGLALPFGNEKTETYLNQWYPIIMIPMVFASGFVWMRY